MCLGLNKKSLYFSCLICSSKNAAIKEQSMFKLCGFADSLRIFMKVHNRALKQFCRETTINPDGLNSIAPKKSMKHREETLGFNRVRKLTC